MNTGQDNVLTLAAVVKGLLPDGQALVELPDKRCINAELSARIKVRFIGLKAGDRVRVELSPFDPDKARIVECL